MKNSKPKKGSIYDRWRIDSEEEPLEPMNGVLTSYYENGQKKEEGMVDNGTPVGKWTYYNEDGSVNEEVEHPSEVHPSDEHPSGNE